VARCRLSGRGTDCPQPWPDSRPAKTMRLVPLYRMTFTTPEAWSVELVGPAGSEGQSATGLAPGQYPRATV